MDISKINIIIYRLTVLTVLQIPNCAKEVTPGVGAASRWMDYVRGGLLLLLRLFKTPAPP